MNVGDALLSLPADLEVWLLLSYALVVLAGARLMALRRGRLPL
jgi:hypothetical protein